jgi:hypothetical protein
MIREQDGIQFTSNVQTTPQVRRPIELDSVSDLSIYIKVGSLLQ